MDEKAQVVDREDLMMRIRIANAVIILDSLHIAFIPQQLLKTFVDH